MVAALSGPGRYEVRISRRAEAVFERLRRQQRARPTIELHRAAPEAGLRTALTNTHAVAYEVLSDQATVLVYAVVTRADLEAQLLGPELGPIVRRREWERLRHGRR